MPAQIPCIIVDDEQDAREGLNFLITNKLPELKVLAIASNAIQALDALIEHKPEICFLDVEMPGKNGLELAKDIRNLQIRTSIIFITSFNQYAIDAIKQQAFDYLLKPVDPDELKTAVQRYRAANQRHNHHETESHYPKLRLNKKNGYLFIEYPQIVYAEAEGNYTSLVLSNGKQEIVCKQLGKLEEGLPSNLFIRINRSNIINSQYINFLDRKTQQLHLECELLKYTLNATREGIQKLNKHFPAL